MFKIILLFPLFIILVYSIHSGFKYTRMISNIFLSLVYNPPVEPPLSSSVGERITILDSGGGQTEGLFVECKRSKQLAIFCHESGATKESWEKYAYFLPGLGFHVLSVDIKDAPAQADKNSLTQWPTQEDAQKLLKVIHWTKRAISEDVAIVLFGVSNGADIAFAASFNDPAVKGVVADGLFSMKEIFRDYIRKWGPILVKPNLFGEKYPDWVVNIFTNLSFWYTQKKCGKEFIDVEKLLHKKHAPLLMIHGQEDDYIPETHQRFLEKMNVKKEVLQRLIVPKAKHNEAVVLGGQVYKEKVAAFLRTL